MKKNLSVIVVVAAYLGLGMSMPACPGQQEVKDQVAAVQAENATFKKKVQDLDSQVKALSKDMTDVKNLLKPMADAIQAQKTALDQLDGNLKEIQSKMAAAKPAPKAKPAGKTGKKR